MVWCSDSCASPIPMDRVNAAELVFVDDQSADGSFHEKKVNRATGAFRSTIMRKVGAQGLLISTDATCTPAEYTPIPVALF